MFTKEWRRGTNITNHVMRVRVQIKVWLFPLNFKSTFFLLGISVKDTDDSQASQGMEETIFYSNLPLPPADEHSDIYFQLYMWNDYHILLIAPLVFTRLLLDEIYHLIELPFDWLMMWC